MRKECDIEMGKFTVNATNVNQIINADVMNAPVISTNQLSSLTPKERDDLIERLLVELQKHATNLSESPKDVSRQQIQALGSETQEIVKDAEAASQTGGHRFDVEKLFDKFRSCFGSATDVLLNAVKLAQLFGVGS